MQDAMTTATPAFRNRHSRVRAFSCTPPNSIILQPGCNLLGSSAGQLGRSVSETGFRTGFRGGDS